MEIRDLELQKLKLQQSLVSAQDEAIELRRIKEQIANERRLLEDDIAGLSNVCEGQMKANDTLARELQLLAEDDEVIKQRLTRNQRILTIKDKNQTELQNSWQNVEKSKSPIRRERHDTNNCGINSQI